MCVNIGLNESGNTLLVFCDALDITCMQRIDIITAYLGQEMMQGAL